MERREWLLYAHTHRSILGAAGHIILTPCTSEQVDVYGAQNLVTVQSGFRTSARPFDHWPNTLTNCANRDHHVGCRTAIKGTVDEEIIVTNILTKPSRGASVARRGREEEVRGVVRHH
jgi:hypothetical protein